MAAPLHGEWRKLVQDWGNFPRKKFGSEQNTQVR